MGRTYVALLRGVNVGTAGRLAMADLRDAVSGLGYGDVRTVLNSGNVVFTAAEAPPIEIAARIEAALAEQLGLRSRVTVVTGEDLASIIAANPLAGEIGNPSRMIVAFLMDEGGVSKLEPLREQDWGDERFGTGPCVAYLWCPAGVTESRLVKAVGRILGDSVTSRAWPTVLKLDALVGGSMRR